MWTPEKVKDQLDKMHYRCTITKSEVKSLHGILQADEQLLAAIEGELKKIHNRAHNAHGMVILTDKRVVFYRKSIIGTVTVEEFPIGKISSSSYRKGIMQASLIIHTSNNEAEFSCFEKGATEQLSKDLQQLIQSHGNKQSGGYTSPSNPGIDIATQLEKLFDLKQKGALSEDDYQAQKNKLLQA